MDEWNQTDKQTRIGSIYGVIVNYYRGDWGYSEHAEAGEKVQHH